MEVGASVWVADAGPETWVEGRVVAKVRDDEGYVSLLAKPEEGHKGRRARRHTHIDASHTH